MAGDISSQFVSALLLVAPLAALGLRLVLTTGVESRPFLLMTLDSLRRFGVVVWHTPDLAEFHVRPQRYTPVSYNVEGDWTAASHLLSLAALAGEVLVENLRLDSTQGDRVVCDLLRQMGASVGSNGDSVSVRRSGLRAVEVNISDCIDLLPSMAVLAAVADGVTELVGISRARLKESNRVFAARQGLERMGIEVREEPDRLKIRGSVPRGAVVDSHGDHRVAMAFTALGLRIGNTVVQGAECVSKTFPDFWEAVRELGGRVVLHE
jgi:3-phosphoshikimate 1-carboxyvinyltransferase